MRINKLSIILFFVACFTVFSFPLIAQQEEQTNKDISLSPFERQEDDSNKNTDENADYRQKSSSQDDKSKSSGFDLGIIVGIEVLDYLTEKNTTEVYQSIGLNPALRFENFEFGLDLQLHYRFSNTDDSFLEVLTEEWIPDDLSLQALLDLYLSKIDVLRWGHEGEAFYLKAGKIEATTIGTGFLMNNYSNSLFQLNNKIVGLNLDLDGQLFNFPLFGIEAVIGNLARFDVLSTRLYLRPFFALDVPVLKDIEIGGSVAMDRTPDIRPEYYDTDTNAGADADMVIMYNGDLIVPILNMDYVSLAVSGNFCYQNSHLGGDAGIGGRFFSVVPYLFQFRIFGDNFIPSYFDHTYDYYRGDKYDIYNITDSTVEVEAGQSWLFSTGVILFEDKLSLRLSADGPLAFPTGDEEIGDLGINYLDFLHLHASLNIAQNLIPNFSANIRYDKMFVNSFEDLLQTDNSVFNIRLTYETDIADVNLEYRCSYSEDDLTELTREDYDVSTSIYCTVKLF